MTNIELIMLTAAFRGATGKNAGDLPIVVSEIKKKLPDMSYAQLVLLQACIEDRFTETERTAAYGVDSGNESRITQTLSKEISNLVDAMRNKKDEGVKFS